MNQIMKNFVLKSIVFLIPVLFLLSCTGEKTKNDLTEINIKGRVKKITEREYYAVEKSGNIAKDSLKDTSVYKYDEKGNSLFSDKDFYHSTDPNCKYDEKGNPIEYSIYREDGSFLFKWKLKWDDKDNVIERSEYSNDGSLTRKEIFIFDNKGNRLERETQIPRFSIQTAFSTINTFTNMMIKGI